MAEALEQKPSSEVFSIAAKMSGSSSLFQRRIEFHHERRPFKGFTNGVDFHIETLNPSSGSNSGRAGFGAGQSGLGVKKAEGSEVLECGLDPELSFGITFRRIVSLCSHFVRIFVFFVSVSVFGLLCV